MTLFGTVALLTAALLDYEPLAPGSGRHVTTPASDRHHGGPASGTPPNASAGVPALVHRLGSARHLAEFHGDLAGLAEARSSAPAVRQLASDLSLDSLRVVSRLVHASATLGIDPAALTTAYGHDEQSLQDLSLELALLQRLASLQGPAFDRAFLSTVAAEMERALVELEGQAADASPAIRELVLSNAAQLRDFRRRARALQAALTLPPR